ncbi:UNVERIFIED_CONTAM: E3 ubiquitin-protein ligase MP [Sesamum calycinum]|uniref:RING-type E3 ubiquitin transferase n=1 Tax=Sesamum calycinum TaxID=2727403 RepID=A0AAW2MPN4_9LAMI
MASSDPPSLPPSLEELSTRGATALLLPWILGMAAATNSSPREVAVFVHQPSRSVTLVEGSLDIESLLREIPSKEGPLPATKASIESLPGVQVSEPGLECPICLAEYEVNREMEVKEMPCRHKFHAGCIDKWLGIHGSCPVCRYNMPVVEKKESHETGGWRIHVFFGRGRPGSNSESESESGWGMAVDEDEEMESGADEAGDGGNDELPAQDM